MTKKVLPKPPVEESASYDNFIGKVSEEYVEPSLAEFLGEPDPIEDKKDWKKHWVGMPAFNSTSNTVYKKVIVSFRNEEGYKEFQKLIGKGLTEKTKSIWFPIVDKENNIANRWVDEEDTDD